MSLLFCTYQHVTRNCALHIDAQVAFEEFNNIYGAPWQIFQIQAYTTSDVTARLNTNQSGITKTNARHIDNFKREDGPMYALLHSRNAHRFMVLENPRWRPNLCNDTDYAFHKVIVRRDEIWYARVAYQSSDLPIVITTVVTI